jgi:hypothetical protein
VAREARRVASRCGGAGSAGGSVGSGGRWRQDDGHQGMISDSVNILIVSAI